MAIASAGEYRSSTRMTNWTVAIAWLKVDTMNPLNVAASAHVDVYFNLGRKLLLLGNQFVDFHRPLLCTLERLGVAFCRALTLPSDYPYALGVMENLWVVV
jgi:hypothetical protein